MRDRLRHALLSAAALTGIAVFTAFALYEKPGLGLGHFFYVAIILAALATGPAIGRCGGHRDRDVRGRRDR